MKYIIAGSRTITNYKEVKAVLDTYNNVTEIVSGGCVGPDRLGERYARHKGIPVKVFKPNWQAYGRSAGPKRNEKMVDYADRLIAFWDGQSRGTKHIIDYAKSVGMVTMIYNLK